MEGSAIAGRGYLYEYHFALHADSGDRHGYPLCHEYLMSMKYLLSFHQRRTRSFCHSEQWTSRWVKRSADARLRHYSRTEPATQLIWAVRCRRHPR